MLCFLLHQSLGLLLLSMLDFIILPHMHGNSRSRGLRVVLLVVLHSVLLGSVLISGVLFGGELLVQLNGRSSKGCWLLWCLGSECSSPRLPALLFLVPSCPDVQRSGNLSVARVGCSVVKM